MRVTVALLAALAVAVPAFAVSGEDEPYIRTCRSSAYGDLGAGWRDRAVVAGHVAFVGLKDGYRGVTPAPAGRARPLKVLVVVDPNAAPTVTIAARSRRFAALGYNPIPGGNPVPLSTGTTSVRFVACRPVQSREPWNRGTQFPGYFLVARPRCVHVEIATAGTVFRRTLRFGVTRCG